MTTLSKLDTMYRETVSKLPKTHRLSYCDHYIDKAQHILATNARFLGVKQKELLKEMIVAAQQEKNEIKKEQ